MDDEEFLKRFFKYASDMILNKEFILKCGLDDILKEFSDVAERILMDELSSKIKHKLYFSHCKKCNKFCNEKDEYYYHGKSRFYHIMVSNFIFADEAKDTKFYRDVYESEQAIAREVARRCAIPKSKFGMVGWKSNDLCDDCIVKGE